jgi:hypothetical protein
MTASAMKLYTMSVGVSDVKMISMFAISTKITLRAYRKPTIAAVISD